MTHENTSGAADLEDMSSSPDIPLLFFMKARNNENTGENLLKQENYGQAMKYYRIAEISYYAIRHEESAKKCRVKIEYCLNALK